MLAEMLCANAAKEAVTLSNHSYNDITPMFVPICVRGAVNREIEVVIQASTQTL